VNPNVAAFLHTIRACEGTDGPDGYRMLFGGALFDDYSQHPNVKSPFRQTDGTTNWSTAAGAYQFLFSTWHLLQTKLNLPDFSPDSQDIAAVELIYEQDALPDVVAGSIQSALDKCWRIWASLPNSQYPQPHRSASFALAAFTGNGGTLA